MIIKRCSKEFINKRIKINTFRRLNLPVSKRYVLRTGKMLIIKRIDAETFWIYYNYKSVYN